MRINAYDFSKRKYRYYESDFAFNFHLGHFHCIKTKKYRQFIGKNKNTHTHAYCMIN